MTIWVQGGAPDDSTAGAWFHNWRSNLHLTLKAQ
jgi:hypothetical protein